MGRVAAKNDCAVLAFDPALTSLPPAASASSDMSFNACSALAAASRAPSTSPAAAASAEMPAHCSATFAGRDMSSIDPSGSAVSDSTSSSKRETWLDRSGENKPKWLPRRTELLPLAGECSESVLPSILESCRAQMVRRRGDCSDQPLVASGRNRVPVEHVPF